jgi:hypothetical protein
VYCLSDFKFLAQREQRCEITSRNGLRSINIGII